MAVSTGETLKELKWKALAELELEETFRGLCNSVLLSLCRTLLKLILIDDSILFLKTSRGFAGNFFQQHVAAFSDFNYKIFYHGFNV